MTPTDEAAVKALLVKAKNIIHDPNRWTKGRLVRQSIQEPIPRFCAMGALYSAANNGGTPYDASVQKDPVTLAATNVLRERVAARNFTGVTMYNDDFATTHADVIRLYDEAIARQAEKVVGHG